MTHVEPQLVRLLWKQHIFLDTKKHIICPACSARRDIEQTAVNVQMRNFSRASLERHRAIIESNMQYSSLIEQHIYGSHLYELTALNRQQLVSIADISHLTLAEVRVVKEFNVVDVCVLCLLSHRHINASSWSFAWHLEVDRISLCEESCEGDLQTSW